MAGDADIAGRHVAAGLRGQVGEYVVMALTAVGGQSRVLERPGRVRVAGVRGNDHLNGAVAVDAGCADDQLDAVVADAVGDETRVGRRRVTQDGAAALRLRHERPAVGKRLVGGGKGIVVADHGRVADPDRDQRPGAGENRDRPFLGGRRRIEGRLVGAAAAGRQQRDQQGERERLPEPGFPWCRDHVRARFQACRRRLLLNLPAPEMPWSKASINGNYIPKFSIAECK